MLYDRPFHLYLRRRAEDGPRRLSLVCPSVPLAPPSQPPTELADGTWAIPLTLQASPDLPDSFRLNFHERALSLGLRHAAVARAMEAAAFDALRRHYEEEGDEDDPPPMLTSQPEPLDWAELLQPANAQLSQSHHYLTLTWHFPEEDEAQLNLITPASIPATAQHIEKDWARLEVGPCDCSPLTIHVRLPSSTSTAVSAGPVRVSRRSLVWQLRKAAETPWLHLSLGLHPEKLLTARFPEACLLQKEAALRRGLASVERRARSHRRRSLPLAPRPITLLSRGPAAAIVEFKDDGLRAATGDLAASMRSLRVETGKTMTAEASSSSPESGIDTGSPESRSELDAPKKSPQSTVTSSGFRPRSLSEADKPLKGILKWRPGLLRTTSECTAPAEAAEGSIPESPFPSLASGIEDLEDSFPEARAKSVRFSERIVRHCFKSNSSIVAIVGEGKNRAKKNAKRKAARLRKNSQGESSEGGSESEESLRSSISLTDEAAFAIHTIPEEPKLRSSRLRPLSISEDEEEDEAEKDETTTPPASRDLSPTMDFESDGDEASGDEAATVKSPSPIPSDAAEEGKKKRKRRKKKKKAAASVAKGTQAEPSQPPPNLSEERKESQDSGIGLDLPTFPESPDNSPIHPVQC